MWDHLRVAVVVPAYDEQRLLPRTLDGMPPEVDGIFVVDDASSDATARVAEGHGDPRVTVLRHRENRGVGAAIVSGYEAAIAQHDIVVVMAADAQMHPDDLPLVVAPIARGQADYVKGNRFRHADRHAMPLHRRLAGRALAIATRRVTGLDVDDPQCGYTAISAEAARMLPLRELWPRYGYPNDMLAMLAEHDLRVTEVPVRPVYADERSGVRPWHAGVVIALLARRWVRRRYPSMARSTIAVAQRRAWSKSKHRVTSSSAS